MGEWVAQVMRIKKHTVVSTGSVESPFCTPETNATLYINWNLDTNFKEKDL